MDDRVFSALLLLIPIVPAAAQPLPDRVVARIAPAPGEPAFTGCIWTALSPDGQTVALTDEAGRLELWDISGKLLKTLRMAGPRWGRACWSPDGQQLYSSHADDVAIWQTAKPCEPRVL